MKEELDFCESCKLERHPDWMIYGDGGKACMKCVVEQIREAQTN